MAKIPTRPIATTLKCSNVLFGQHLGGAFVQPFSAPHLFETRQQSHPAEAAVFRRLENGR